MSRWHHTYKWTKTRILSLIKNKHTCDITGSMRNIYVHHLNDASTYPELRYKVSNTVLCTRKVHIRFHIKFMGGYRVSCTKEDWERFKEETKDEYNKKSVISKIFSKITKK